MEGFGYWIRGTLLADRQYTFEQSLLLSGAVLLPHVVLWLVAGAEFAPLLGLIALMMPFGTAVYDRDPVEIGLVSVILVLFIAVAGIGLLPGLTLANVAVLLFVAWICFVVFLLGYYAPQSSNAD